MTQNLKQRSPYEDEIDLRDVIKILIEYKKLIISIMLIFTLAGSIYSYPLKASFETKTVLEVGYFEIDGEKQYIQSPSDLMHDLNIQKIQNFKEISPVNLFFEKSEDRLITIKAQSSSIEQNKNILNEFIRDTLESHSKALELAVDNKKQFPIFFRFEIDLF